MASTSSALLSNPAAAAAPLPPLPNLPTQPGQGSSAPASQDFLASIMSGVAPVKNAVDAINAACKSIVQSGAVPGSEQVCGQIIALSSSLLPMAIQQATQPGMGGQSAAPGAGGPPGLGAMPPSPGGPAPIGQ